MVALRDDFFSNESIPANVMEEKPGNQSTKAILETHTVIAVRKISSCTSVNEVTDALNVTAKRGCEL